MLYPIIYCTTRVTGCECWVEDSVAVTVTVKVFCVVGVWILTLPDPDLVESAEDVAVMVTVAGFGTGSGGAVYSPVLSTVPLAAPPVTAQVTAVLDVPVTLAVNC